MRATSPDCFSDGKRLVPTLNCAWTSDYRELIAADSRVADAHDSLFRSQIERDQFVRLADANCFRDSGQVLEVRRVNRTLISGDANGGASSAGHRVAFETQLLDDAQDSLDLAVGRVVFHYD